MKKKISYVLIVFVAICILYIKVDDIRRGERYLINVDRAVKYVNSAVLLDEEELDMIEEVIASDDEEETSPVTSAVQNEIIVGKMSGYGPDCDGCSGYLAYGKYVGDGTIYYDDAEYGQVRIVAGDRKYAFGTIVRINDSMLAIVLDRGGVIGIGKRCLFDLLYESEEEANKYGISYDVKFEILRNGF